MRTLNTLILTFFSYFSLSREPIHIHLRFVSLLSAFVLFITVRTSSVVNFLETLTHILVTENSSMGHFIVTSASPLWLGWFQFLYLVFILFIYLFLTWYSSKQFRSYKFGLHSGIGLKSQSFTGDFIHACDFRSHCSVGRDFRYFRTLHIHTTAFIWLVVYTTSPAIVLTVCGDRSLDQFFFKNSSYYYIYPILPEATWLQRLLIAMALGLFLIFGIWMFPFIAL